MKDYNIVTVTLRDDTVKILNVLKLRLKCSACEIIERLIWDASDFAFSRKELLLLLGSYQEFLDNTAEVSQEFLDKFVEVD